eukprot:824750-Pelagomonas_calceolata.AAC.9
MSTNGLVPQVCDLQPGEFVHMMGDTHIYANHVEPLQEQLRNPPRHFPGRGTAVHKHCVESFCTHTPRRPIVHAAQELLKGCPSSMQLDNCSRVVQNGCRCFGLCPAFSEELNVSKRHTSSRAPQRYLSREGEMCATLKINPAKKDIDSFVLEDFELIGYNPHKKIDMKMAV